MLSKVRVKRDKMNGEDQGLGRWLTGYLSSGRVEQAVNLTCQSHEDIIVVPT